MVLLLLSKIFPIKFQKKEDNGHHKGAFLIISPSSVLYNWEDELNTWGYFKIARFHGNSKKETLKNARKGKLDVVLTTYETFRMHIVSSFIHHKFNQFNLKFLVTIHNSIQFSFVHG